MVVHDTYEIARNLHVLKQHFALQYGVTATVKESLQILDDDDVLRGLLGRSEGLTGQAGLGAQDCSCSEHELSCYLRSKPLLYKCL